MTAQLAGRGDYALAAGSFDNRMDRGLAVASSRRRRRYLWLLEIWPFSAWERRRRALMRVYFESLPVAMDVVKAWPEADMYSDIRLRRYLMGTFARVAVWAFTPSIQRLYFQTLGTVGALAVAVADVRLATIVSDDVGSLGVNLAIFTALLCCVATAVYFWKSDRSLMSGIVTSGGFFLVAALARLPAIGAQGYFSKINPRNGLDLVTLFVLANGIMIGYLATLGRYIRFLLARAQIELEILRRAFDLIAILRSVRAPIVSVSMKQKAIVGLQQLLDVLLSGALLRTLRTGDISADLVVFNRVRGCAQRLRELQIWLALPRLDTIPLVRREVVSLVAVVAVGAYDFLPQARGEIPQAPGRARILLASLRILGAFIPVGVLVTFTVLGLRLPEAVGVPTYVLSFLWLVYCLAQALKFDASGFAKFAADTASAAKNLGLTGKASDQEGDKGAAAEKAS